MENKQTAVEWLNSQITFNGLDDPNGEVLEQAKQMEKEQIKDAFDKGYIYDLFNGGLKNITTKLITNKEMRTITKSVINLSEIPEELQKNELLLGHKKYTLVEFHIDDSENDLLTLWLLNSYPTLKRKISFFIYID
jgi:hypothetical protein